MEDKVTPVVWIQAVEKIVRKKKREFQGKKRRRKKQEEKVLKNKSFLFLFLNRLQVLVNKHISLWQSQIQKWWQMESTQDLKTVALFVFGYGILGEFVALTVGGYSLEWQTPIHVMGWGSLMYLFMDILKYCVETIRK